ncbi:MAG TPA: wax ester/triacylglycerol synthase family O-acyltransferase [Actinomycetota bacterium]|nr:wax ester/triacylglycerol synthase family O-acyltransferase [Actinomycetota bacterium]
MNERLSTLDASFLYLEKPNVHMHVAGLAILDPSTRPDGRLGIDDITRLIEQRIHLVPRFRQRVVFPPLSAGRPVWADDPTFDLEFHTRRAALPAPGGRRELADFVQRVHSRPLDRTKPLWEMYLIEGLEDDHVAILSKSHHAMIDGLSGMDIATVMFDFSADTAEVKAPTAWEPSPEPAPGDLWLDAIRDQISHPVRTAVENAARAIRAPQEAWHRVRTTLGGVAAVLAKGQADAGPFNGRIGSNRRFAMAEVPVADMKAIKNALGGTVNDVVLASVTGGLRTLLRSRKERVTGVTLRAMVPVSTRDDSRTMALGNQVSMFFVDLPVGVRDPVKRLRTISRETEQLKSSHAAVGAAAIMNTARWAPPTLHALAARLVSRSRFANLVVSNVPGPQVPLYLAGAKLVIVYPVMPLAETLGLSVAVTSLSGTMGFGFTSDWGSIPDIDVMANGLLDAISDLKKAARV